MKKFVIILILIVSVFNLTGCNIDFLSEQSEKIDSVNDIFDQLFECLENDDVDAIKEMFAPKVRNESLNMQIEQMCSYFEGEVSSHFGLNTPSESKSVREGKIVRKKITNARYRHVETNKDIYKISFSAITIDENDSNNVGLWRIWIGKSDEDYMIIGNSDMPD